MLKVAILLIGSYVLGSIPFGLLIVKAWCGVDIRQHGSGNIGATNVLRTAGKAAAVIVFLADVLKGLIPVAVARHFLPDMPGVTIAAGLLSLVGHTASIFLKFRGGKGVATGLGIFIGVNPLVAAIALGVWTLVVLTTRYVSVASIAGATTIPIMMFAFSQPTPYKVFAIFAAAYVVAKHRSNIARLARGIEPRLGEKTKTPEGQP